MVEKFNFLDESGVQTLANYILRSANSRIAERISTSVVAGSYSDQQHVLAASAILGLIGNIDNYAVAQGEQDAIDPTGSTVLSKIKALQLAIGQLSDAANAGTVYGEIAKVRSEISDLTHLTYQVITGPITTQVPAAEAKTDVIYLQHDNDGLDVGLDGYLLDSNGDHATYGSGAEAYEAYVSNGVIYKVVDGEVTETVIDPSSDPIIANVNKVADNTYNLYIAQPTAYAADGKTPSAVDWICVGDTSLELANYWDKSDASVNELKNRILESISAATIQTKVAAAYAATDPFNSETVANAYVS